MMARLRGAWWLLLALLVIFGCDDEGDEQPLDPVIIVVSPSPDSVVDSTPSLVGRVQDFVTATALPNSVVSTLPPTALLRTNGLGEFILTEGVVPGRLYEIRAESNGYVPSVVAVQARAGKAEAITLPLIPSDLALPVRAEPSVLVYSPERHSRTVSLVNDADAALELEVQAPDWLVVPTLGRLGAGERREVIFRLEPEALSAALGELAAGEVLQGEVRLSDGFGRVLILHSLVIPAMADQLSFALVGPDMWDLRVGQAATVQVQARYLDVPLVGAALGIGLDEGGGGVIRPSPGPFWTDEQGIGVVPVEAMARGDARLSLSVIAFPDAGEVGATFHVTSASPCAVDEDGLNACGDATLWRCSEDDHGEAVCEDIDECAVDLRGINGCGDAGLWDCTNVPGAPPVCEDIDECATQNGGCGDTSQAICVNQDGLPPVCHERSGCSLDEAGFNDCGDATRWTCIPGEGGTVDCIDLDECATDNGGCGDPRFFACTNREGLPAACADIDECVVDAQGNNGCGDAARWRCVNRPGDAPICQDIDECAVDAEGHNACGEARFWRCANHDGAAPECADLDECAPDANGRNACGEAARWTCTNAIGAAAGCVDIDECQVNILGQNGCGDASQWDCANQPGQAPLCADLDDCTVRGDGQNACGEASLWVCTNQRGAPATCADRDECATNNGGCGDPSMTRCVNQLGAPPLCESLDRCTPDADGLNACGVAFFYDCFDPPVGDVVCQPRNLCASNEAGQNACGDARYWTCVNTPETLPTCTDIDECAVNNGSCGDPTRVQCVNRLGALPRCVDVDECATDNGGCGPVVTKRCINRVNAPPVCEDIDQCEPDAAGLNICGDADQWICADSPATDPTCEDIDDCVVVNQRTTCGSAFETLCTNLVGEPARCVRCEAGTTNLDGAVDNGCEYACGPPIAESCNRQDDVTVSHITFIGGRTGVQVGTGAPLSFVHLHDIAVSGIRPNTVGSYQEGISGFGVRVDDVRGFTLSGSSITSIEGGDGALHQGTNPQLRAGSAYGVYLQDVLGCLLEGNSVSQMVGGTGHFATQDRSGGNGGHAFGIRLINSSTCEISHNQIATLTGGTGGTASGHFSRPGQGGFAVGIQLDTGSASNAIRDNLATQIVAGNTGWIGYDDISTSGGTAAGIRLVDTRLTTVDRNVVELVQGGDSSLSRFGTYYRDVGGPTWGVDLVRAPDSTVTHLQVWKLRSSHGQTAPTVACAEVNDASGLTFRHMTCHDVGQNLTANTSGVHATPGQTAPFTISHSIFSTIAGPAVRSLASANTATASWTMTWMCADPTFVNTVTSGFLYDDDPLFVDPARGDLHLLPTSPAVDAGDPVAPYGEEPEPNGCAPNLGAWGNSAFATQRPGATNCP